MKKLLLLLALFIPSSFATSTSAVGFRIQYSVNVAGSTAYTTVVSADVFDLPVHGVTIANSSNKTLILAVGNSTAGFVNQMFIPANSTLVNMNFPIGISMGNSVAIKAADNTADFGETIFNFFY